MKRVKLMLLSLSILAVVGGALAFTAKKSGAKFCVITTTSSTVCPAFCPNFSSIKDRILATDYVCTTPTSGDEDKPCKAANGVTDLPCPLVPQNSTVE